MLVVVESETACLLKMCTNISNVLFGDEVFQQYITNLVLFCRML